MPDKMNDKRNKISESADTDASVQEELSRESAEGQDSIGDVGSNRTLSGSSSWETLPSKSDTDGSATKPGKQSGNAASTPQKPGKK